MKKLVCSVLFLGVIGMFSAQEKESEISEITVQGKFLNLPLKKVNENITVISKQELENSPAKSIEEAFHIRETASPPLKSIFSHCIPVVCREAPVLSVT